MYRFLFSAVLRRLDPERAHALARDGLRLAGGTRLGKSTLRRVGGATDPVLRTRAFGLTLASPLGAAAGVDKDASWPAELHGLGFGFVEVGTVTALPQAGNPPPRVARLVPERALVNRMGFPNPGAAAVAHRLASPGRRGDGVIIGVNVGKSMAVSLQAAAADYRAAIGRLGPLADYLVLNVSSPNTPGLRDMQSPVALRALVGEIRAELDVQNAKVPLLVKIAPDLGDEEVDEVGRLALELELDGLVAVNTTTDRTRVGGRVPFEGGGVSGPPLRRRAVEVLHRLRSVVGERIVLVSVGGVEGAGDVWERILAGATLVQAYTGFVYGGPAWPRRVNRDLARMVRASGARSIHELVGLSAPD